MSDAEEYEKFTEWFEGEDFCNDYVLGAHAKECVYRAWLERARLENEK
jgi:hypothetical protein